MTRSGNITSIVISPNNAMNHNDYEALREQHDHEQDELLKRQREELRNLCAKNAARIAYAAYGEAVGGKNFRGDPMPQFDELPDVIQLAWSAASFAGAKAWEGVV